MDKYVIGLSSRVMNNVFRNRKFGVEKPVGERVDWKIFASIIKFLGIY